MATVKLTDVKKVYDNKVVAVHGFNLDEIRIAGGAVCDASGHDDVVSGLEREHLLRRPQRVIKQDVGGIELLA